MQDPQCISPLLDGFTMGSPMSSRSGIECCPAIQETTEEKYIVKIISVPATQRQLDAMLLAGAYKDPADAMDYFREMGEGIMKEAELLRELSKLDGFLSYDGWQMVPITRKRLGYYVYLLSPYRRSLEKYIRQHPVTHLEALNLSLDLCSALSACRQAGSLYVDLKPGNIFVSEKKEYQIGDLGFLSLDSLRYSTIPDRCRSVYTPPELFDPMNPVNLTVDTYAVGMILYQLYNDGTLPFRDKAPEEALPSPLNADYELAEIIMKAIHPDPAQRWEDPKDLGQALVSYMQRNVVNDVPITPYTPLEQTQPQEQADADAPAESAEPAAGDAAGAEAAVSSEEPVSGEEPPAPEEPEVPADEEAVPADAQPDDPAPSGEAPGEPAEDAAEEAEEALTSPPEQEQDDTAPSEQDAEELLPHEMSDELSRIMAKADDLISHEPPEGVVLPQIPDPPDPFAFAREDAEDPDDSDVPKEPLMEEPEEPAAVPGKKGGSFASQKGKRRAKKLIATLALLLTLSAAGFGSYWFYQNMYLQTVRAIDIDGTRESLTVTIDSNIKDSLLRVICSDKSGNAVSQSVVNGQATFTGLTPDTLYTVRLEIDGFHSLVGQTSDNFTTDTTTTITTLTPTAGETDGSVILSFTVEGTVPEEWTLSYMAPGEEEQVLTFTGNTVSITDLTVGKLYTFVLDAGDNLSVSGETTLEYMASRLIQAQNVQLSSDSSDTVTVHWTAPGDTVVDSWQVRCYSENGYDQSQTVAQAQAQFTGIDPAAAYTLEITAEGMTQPARASLTANPIRVSGFQTEESASQLTLRWDYTGTAPAEGWLLMYSIDGSSVPNVLKCTDASAAISPRVPGAKYRFTLQSADGSTVLNNSYTYQCPQAPDLDEHNLTAGKISGKLLPTPDKTGWRMDSLEGDAYTDQFAPGQSISLVLHADAEFYLPGYEMEILYVLRDSYGNVRLDLLGQEKTYWSKFWSPGDSHYGELTLPQVPQSPGSYTLSLYFDGAFVGEFPFTVTE